MGAMTECCRQLTLRVLQKKLVSDAANRFFLLARERYLRRTLCFSSCVQAMVHRRSALDLAVSEWLLCSFFTFCVARDDAHGRRCEEGLDVCLLSS